MRSWLRLLVTTLVVAGATTAFKATSDGAPSTVKPFYGQPRGSIEITTESPIDVGRFPFQLFELPGAQQ